MTAARGMKAALAGALTLMVMLAVEARPVRADVIERVVAVINDDAVFLSDLRRRAVPFLPQVASASSETERLARMEQLYGELLDHLIEEKLFEFAARKMRVRVMDADVNRAIKNVQRQVGLEGDAFWEAVREQGLTEAQYRHDLKRQLLRLKVLNERVRSRVNITEEDVRRKYDERLRRAMQKMRFRASHCFLPVSEGASATDVKAVRQQAEEARQGLSASTFSQCVDAHGGGDLGWLSQGDLPADLEKELHALQPGEVSSPVRGSSGYHIFLVHERERGDADIPPFEQVKEKLFRQMLDKAMSRQEKAFLDELRREAVISKKL